MASKRKHQPFESSAHDSDILRIHTRIDQRSGSLDDPPRFRFDIRRLDQTDLRRIRATRFGQMVEVSEPLVDSTEKCAAQILPRRLGRIRWSIEDHHATVNPNEGQQEIGRNTRNIGEAVDQKSPRGQRLCTHGMDPVLGDLECLGRSPDGQLFSLLEDLRSEPNKRLSSFDAFGRNLIGDLVEALDHSFFVAGLESSIEQIANRTDDRVVAVDELTQGRVQRGLSRSETTHEHLEPGITTRRRHIPTRQQLHRKAKQGLNLKPGDPTATAGNRSNQVMTQAPRRDDDAYRKDQILCRRWRQTIDLLEQSPLRFASASAGNNTRIDVRRVSHLGSSHGTTCAGHCQ